MNNYLLLLICIVGLCLGSFYNVVIIRSLSGESIVFPASKCPKCGHKLYPWHNIPVLSYIFLRGKCYFCKEKISLQYPVVELVTMLMFVFAYLKFGLSTDTLFAIILLSGLIIMTTTDIKEKLVDCNIAIILALCGLLFCYLRTGSIIAAAVGLITGAVIIELIALTGCILPAKTRVMGEADTYVAAALGSYFGMGGFSLILLYSIAAALIFTLPVYIYNQYKINNKITCILFILFTLAVVVFKAAFQSWLAFSFVIITGILLAISVLKNIKSTDNRHYLPFVPALAAGTLFFMFF